MNTTLKMFFVAGLAASAIACNRAPEGSGTADGDFKYLIDEFADIKIMKYQIPGWDELSFRQKSR